MKLRIIINLDNAAFEDNGPAFEVKRIIDQLMPDLETGFAEPITLWDSNGNAVGRAEVIEN